MLKKREQQILEIMYENSPNVYTSEDLALILNVSSRTIKKDLEAINFELKKNDGKINSARGKGYWLDEKTKEKMSSKISHNLLQKISIDNTKIIEFLLFRKSFVPVYEIAEEFFYSESAILRKINEINSELEKYDLKIIREPGKGIKLIGKEKNQRIMHAEILKDQNMSHNGLFYSKQLKNDLLFENFNDIQSLLIEFQRKHEIGLSDIAQAGLAIDITITINRIKTNENITFTQNEINDLKQNIEWYYALSLASMLEEKFTVIFSESEIGFLSIHLLSANLSNDELPKTFSEISKKIDQDLLLELVNWIENIDHQFNTELHEDMQFLSSLALHLKPMLKRLQHKITLTNPWIKDLKENHSKAYEMSVSLAQEIQRNTGYTITNHEIAYLAMHIGGALERDRINESINIIIVCASGIGTSNFLKNRLRKLYPQFNVVKILPSFSEELQKIDNEVIISTVPIENKNNNVIYVSPILTENDQTSIDNFLQNHNYSFDEYFDKNLFLNNFEAKSKFEVLKQSSHLLYEHGYVKKGYFNDLVEREELSSTEIGNLIAIPHAISQNVIKTGICVIILDEPINWKDTSVQIIFILSFNTNDDESAIEIIDRISNFSNNFSLINETIRSSTFKEFKENFERVNVFNK